MNKTIQVLWKKKQGVLVKLKSVKYVYIYVFVHTPYQVKYSSMHEYIGMYICTKNWLCIHETHSPGH